MFSNTLSLFSDTRAAAEGTMNKLGQLTPQGQAPCARYLRGIVIFQMPYVMFFLQEAPLFAVLKLDLLNSLKLQINLSHSKHSALETFLMSVIAVYSDIYHEPQKYNA
jgi:hypothetical protein